jgi:hypothetical protein
VGDRGQKVEVWEMVKKMKKDGDAEIDRRWRCEDEDMKKMKISFGG